MRRPLVLVLFAFFSFLSAPALLTRVAAQEKAEPAQSEPAKAEPAAEAGKATEAASGESAKEGAEEAKGELEVPIELKWINFGLMAAGLLYLIVKNLPKNLAERTAAIQKDITEAQKVKADAEARAAQVEARLTSLGADIEKFRTQAAVDMKAEGERIRQETVVQIQRVQGQVLLEIESAGKFARRELKQYSADLALKLAEQRVRARLDASTEAALIDGFVMDLGKAEQGSEASRN